MNIATLITLFATLTASQPTELCDVVYADTGRPIFCEPHPDGAPRHDSTVCCDAAGCVASPSGACSTSGRTLYFCELGEVGADGKVSCYLSTGM